jgi:regulator of protease activity HflC (stomatin/prohibitin superfamily)
LNQFFQWLSELFQGVRVWTIVLPWERGLRVRLGRWTRLWEPGFHWRVPFVDHVRVINTRVRIASIPCVTVTTKDGKTVTVAGCVGFQIVDPYQALLTIQQPEDAAAALAMSALASYVLARDVDQLDIAELEGSALEVLRQAPLRGFAFTFVKIVDFAIVRTFRLLQEQWRPNTGFTNFEPPKS